MVKKKSWHNLARFFEIPADIVLDMPRLTMLGNQQLLIENHRGIILYDASLLRIKVDAGEVVVAGDGLSLGNVEAEQILVEGRIAYVAYNV